MTDGQRLLLAGFDRCSGVGVPLAMALQGVSNSPCMEASAATRMAAEAVFARSGSERSSRGKRTNALLDFRMSCMASRRQHPGTDW